MKVQLARVLGPGVKNVDETPRPERFSERDDMSDETVVCVDNEIAGALDQTQMGLAVFDGSALLTSTIRPGYGLHPLVGPSPLVGDRISKLDGTTAEASDTAEPPGQPDADIQSYLKIQGRRIKLTNLGLEGIELGLKETLGGAYEPYAPMVDVMQVVVGGAGFANALQKDGWTSGTLLSGTGLAADVVSALSHSVPALSSVAPYAKGVSIGIKIYKAWNDDVGVPARIDVLLDDR